MTQKKETTKKKFACPTCGKFLNNDVAALRQEVSVLIGERDQLRRLLDKAQKEMMEAKSGMCEWALSSPNGKVEKFDGIYALYNTLNHVRMVNEKLEEKLNRLQEYSHWLVSRNLWQRILNELQPGE